MSMTFQTPNTKEKIERQIKALKKQLETDINEKDIKYHKMALEQLEKKLKEMK